MMRSLSSTIIVLVASFFVLASCSHNSSLKENTIIAYYDSQGNQATTAIANGSYRKLLKITVNGYIVQNFFIKDDKKQTEPFIIKQSVDLTKIDPLSLNGPFLQWHENGQLAGKGMFINGKRIGQFIEWTNQGKKMMEMTFTNDIPNGPAILWYENGNKYIEGQYWQGKEQGTWKIWQQDGSLKYTVTFKEGYMMSTTDAKGNTVQVIEDDLSRRY